MKTNHNKDEHSDVEEIEVVVSYLENLAHPIAENLPDNERINQFIKWSHKLKPAITHLQEKHEAEKRELIKEIEGRERERIIELIEKQSEFSAKLEIEPSRDFLEGAVKMKNHLCKKIADIHYE